MASVSTAKTGEPVRIFFICQRVPFPPDRGDKIATFNEIRHLARAHEVHVFCLGDGAHDLDNIPGVRDHAASVTAVRLGRPASRLRALGALITGGPLSVAAFDEPRLHRAIRQQFDALKPDLIIVYSGNVARYAEPFAQVPRIMQFSDLDSLKWGQYAARAQTPMKWIYATEQRRLLDYERHIARSFSHALVCTAAEQRDFERLIPGVPVSIVGNGVDLDYFRSAGRAKHPGSMVFTGVMDYLPNVDAVCWLCDEILPSVQAEIPAASLTICGSRPSAAVRRLAKRPGVRVTGRVADTRPYLDEAELFAAPLRLARGIQNKLLEAMAMGLACVTSTIAWNATAIPGGEGILATDDPKEFVAHIVRLLRDGEYRALMARRARGAVEANYRWDMQMARLDRVIAAVTGSPTPAGSPLPAEA